MESQYLVHANYNHITELEIPRKRESIIDQMDNIAGNAAWLRIS